jgi:hypothetical protein
VQVNSKVSKVVAEALSQCEDKHRSIIVLSCIRVQDANQNISLLLWILTNVCMELYGKHTV